MFCGTLANKIINKIIKSVFKLKIQIFIKNHPSPPPQQKCRNSRPTRLAGCTPQTISLITTAGYLSVRLGLNNTRFLVPVHHILYFRQTTVDSVSDCRTQVQQNTHRQNGSSLMAVQAGAVVRPLA